jgi:hypothetical protein
MSQFHPLRGPLALALVMVHISPHMETPPMEMEQRTLTDSVAILGEVNPPIVQGIPMQITMSPTMTMRGLVSAGEQATPTLRHMILLVHGRDAISWQRGCLSHLNLGSMAMCKFLNIKLRVFRSFLFTQLLLDLTQNWMWLRDSVNPAAGCRPLEKTMDTLMAATLTELGILTCLDET